MPYTLRHTVETDVDTFWRLQFDPDFVRAMMESLGGTGVRTEVESSTDEDGVLHRRVEYAPGVEVPALVEKLLGDGSYTEFGRYEPASKKYVARYVPKIGADKFTINLEVSVEPLGDKRCERVMVTENVVNIFGLGKTIEKFIEQSQRTAQDRAIEFTNTWIREKGL